MNRMQRGGGDMEARLAYHAGEFEILSPGSYVTCAVTGKRIALEDLRYWSLERQEAYVDATASLKRHPEMSKDLA